MVAWWNLGLPRLVFSPELAPIHGWIEITYNNLSNPGEFAVAGAESRKVGTPSRHRLQAPVRSSA